MKAVILAGGYGTRLEEAAGVKPKPMVEVGGLPILWHIMGLFARAGCKEFVIALGYRGNVIKEYFLNHFYLNHDCTIRLDRPRPEVGGGQRLDWTVHLVDTGLETQTGGRLRRLKRWVQDGPFFMTYGDGLADVSLTRLASFHRRHGKLATVTAVRPPARFGGLLLSGNRVRSFREKPQMGEGWINGGFFVLDPRVLDYADGDACVFERDPLERLARQGNLMAYRHTGFWQCVDTPRDLRYLESLWGSGRAPWKTPAN